jgi:hypothetical protein
LRKASTPLELALDLILLVGFTQVALHNSHTIIKLFEVGQMLMEYVLAGPVGMTVTDLFAEEAMCLGNTLLASNLRLKTLYKHELASRKQKRKERQFNLICKVYIALVGISTVSLVIFFMIPTRKSSESLNLVTFFWGDNASMAGRLAFAFLMGFIGFKTAVRMMCAVFLLLGSLQLLREWIQLACKCKDKVDTISYQSMQIFNIVVRDYISPLILPTVLFGIYSLLVITCTAIILLHSQLPWAFLIVCATFVVAAVFGIEFFTGFLNNIHQNSCALIKSTEHGPKYRCKPRGALFPISFRVGCLFTMKPCTKLTFLQLTFDQVTEFVLMG